MGANTLVRFGSEPCRMAGWISAKARSSLRHAASNHPVPQRGRISTPKMCKAASGILASFFQFVAPFRNIFVISRFVIHTGSPVPLFLFPFPRLPGFPCPYPAKKNGDVSGKKKRAAGGVPVARLGGSSSVPPSFNPLLLCEPCARFLAGAA